jgi:hypothetical protein
MTRRTQSGKLGGLEFAQSTQKSTIYELGTRDKLDRTIGNDISIAETTSADKAGTMM